MNAPTIATRAAWLEARKALFEKERAMTHQLEALHAERRRLPWVRRAELAVRPVVVGLMLGAVATILRQQAVGHGVLVTAAVGLLVAGANKRLALSPLLLLLGAGALFGLLSPIVRL